MPPSMIEKCLLALGQGQVDLTPIANILDDIFGRMGYDALQAFRAQVTNPSMLRAIVRAQSNAGNVDHVHGLALNEMQPYMQAWQTSPVLQAWWQDRGGFGAFMNAARRPW